MKIKGAKVFSAGRFVSQQQILIREGRIDAITPSRTDATDLEFPADSYILPGMIDLHIHGAKGFDVMDGTTTALENISLALAEEGVTGFLPTTMTESIPKIDKALDAIKQFQTTQTLQGAEVLGIHLEGPFLSKEYMGAQCGDFLLNPDTHLLSAWQKRSGQLIKLLTLAPELKGAIDFIHTASQLGIVISVGHTAASFTETEQAIDAGARHATHLFNAMSGVHHRHPGAAAAILSDDRITAELVADGHHVVAEMLKFAIKCKGLARLVLVSDAMRAKCLKNGDYDLGGQVVSVRDTEARLKKNGVLAGSVLCMNSALRNFVNLTGTSLEEAVALVTEIPAKILKKEQEIGTLAPSKKANLVVLNSHLDVLCTIREGQVIYKRS